MIEFHSGAIMISLYTFKLISITLITLIAIAGGYFPFRHKHLSGRASDSAVGQALASGIFLGAGLIHMLSDASQDFNALHIDYPLPFLLAGCMFLFLLLLEHIARQMLEHGQSNHAAFSILSCLILSIHSLLAGAALGLAQSLSISAMLFVAIIAHKWAASYALATQINQSNLNWKKGLFLFSIFAIMTPIGILGGEAVNHTIQNYHWLTPTFNALAAGTFLYMGTLHGLSRSIMIKHCCDAWQFSYVVLGFALMAVVAVWT
jgi:zinc transporter 1/2/3